MVSKKRLEKYKKLMERWCSCDDNETAHGFADSILCQLLDELGYGEIVILYSKVGKWYA